jgi:uncharacterized protein YjbI with pentapeptide repeats
VICHRRAEIDAQSIDRPTMALTALLNEERQSGSSLGRFSWPLTLFRVEFPEVEVSPKVDLSVLTCRKSHLPGLNLSGANLTNATWTNGSKCKDPSISQCNL